MIVKLLPSIVALLLTIICLQTPPIDGAINIPWSISRFFGLSSDVTLEFTRLNKLSSLLSKVGLLGPFALSFFSKAGLALGVLGTAATAATAFAFATNELRKRDEPDYYDRNYYNYRPYYPYHTNKEAVNSYQHFRRKRSLDKAGDNLMNKITSFEKKLEEEEGMFEVVRQSDESKCAEKLICELASKPKRELLQDEILILSLIRKSHQFIQINPKFEFLRASSPYERAFHFGLQGRSCSSFFPMCPFNHKQIMSLLRLFN
ncbi:UNVERIFIED_CONTAM: hypothetical protein RMT77_010173 [Armadillidium vulgare]